MVGSMTSPGTTVADVAGQLAMLERHVQAVAGGDLRRIADDGRTVRIPADGVSAREHVERAETLEPRGGAAQASVRPVNPSRESGPEAPLRRDKTRAHAAEAAPEVERLEQRPERLVGPLAPRETGAAGAPQGM